MELKFKEQKISFCFLCGETIKNKPELFSSKINLIPEGLDRKNFVKAYVYRCKKCRSFSCLQMQEQKNYSESLCHEASKKTLENSAEYYPYSSDLIPSIIKNNVKENIWVDFGCGAGFFAKEMKKYSKNVIGVDLDPKSRNLLKKNKIDFYQGDKEILNDIKFDSISLVGVLEHFKEPLKFLTDLSNLLPVSNSYILIFYPNTSSLSALLSRLSHKPWDMFMEPGHFSFPSKEILIKEMFNNNFKLKKYWTTSNISRGKNPFALTRNVFLEKTIKEKILRNKIIKFVYLFIYRCIDIFKLGDISCFLFYR